MALSMIRVLLVPHFFNRSSSLVVRAASIVGQNVIRSIFSEEALRNHNFTGPQQLDILHKLHQNPCLCYYSTAIQCERIYLEGSSHAILLGKLEIALKDHQMSEAWEVFNDFKRLYGFPNRSLLSRLVIELSYSFDSHWLQKGYDLVLLILKEKPDLLHHEFLTRLALSLSRAQMPTPTSTILRLLLEKDKFPSMDIWRTLFYHLVKTEIGTYLASDILVEICDCILCKTSKCTRLVYPDTIIFNIVMDACVRYGSTLKGQQIIELMPRIGIVADAISIVIIAQIYEINGQRDELKKFKDHIDSVLVPLVRHYRQFYDSLLSLHFKFNDIDAAARLMLDIYGSQGSLCHSVGLNSKDRRDPQKLHLVPIGSCYLRTELKLKIEPNLLRKDYVFDADSRPKGVIFTNGKLVFSNKALAKLINGYKREGKLDELSKLLVSIEKVLGFSGQPGLSSDVMDACIQLGWLETAHDILDDMESVGRPKSFISYMSLLKAYCKGNMLKEMRLLLKQMRKTGLLINLSDEKVISQCLSKEDTHVHLDTKPATLVGKSGLAESLIQEMREEGKALAPLFYEIDSSICFFCKAKMMEDALKAYRRMQERKIQPSVQTFTNLLNGYSSLGMYREITILWGEIRRRMDSGDLAANRDLLDFLLWNFIHGGYFERVMEVISYMTKHSMYVDKWKYKKEFLKFHKDLYRSLKASKAKTEAQSKRLEHVRTFRKWVGIN